MKLLILCYAPEDVYNVEEVGIFYQAQPNKTLVQQKFAGAKFRRTKSTTYALKHVDSSKLFSF
jgi:hypothetical protein